MAVSSRFPKSTRTQIWETIRPILRRAPSLAGVKGWFLYEGDPKRDTRDIDLADLPSIKIRISCGPAHWIDEARHSTTLIFTHEIAVEGTRQTDLIDLWAAIEGAWFDGTNTLLDSLIPFLGWQKTITGPNPVPQAIGGGVAMTGTGVITISMDLAT